MNIKHKTLDSDIYIDLMNPIQY